MVINSRPPDPALPMVNTGPRSLAQALRAVGISLDNPSHSSGTSTPSEEDYDENVRPSLTKNLSSAAQPSATRRKNSSDSVHQRAERVHVIRRDSGVHIYPDDEAALEEFLKRNSFALQDAKEIDPSSGTPRQRRGRGESRRFRDFVFTKQVSAFDRSNAQATSSPFHGFYTLFWLGIALFVVKISAENWRVYGNPLGGREIVRTMFRRDVVVMLASDGIMCALTGVSWAIQRLVFRGTITWNGAGWILQNIWQTSFIIGLISWTLIREWPWTHTVFFVLHGLVMLMKQHAYAFYNGYLSSVFVRRNYLRDRLAELEAVGTGSTSSAKDAFSTAISTTDFTLQQAYRQRKISHNDETAVDRAGEVERISSAIKANRPLTDPQVDLCRDIVKEEVEVLTLELQGTASDPSKAYPNNLTFWNHYRYIPLPTLVYEIEYPETEAIDWSSVVEKLIAMVGVLFVMIQVSQYSIYPIVMKTVAMKENNIPLADRMREFPWLLSDLIFPFMVEYLLVWYLIWETILNILAELTRFADRSFYDTWWNSVSWDQFARDWNRPVHVFLLRHVYHSSISSLKLNKHAATITTFFLSACVHELVMWCIFKKLRGYLLVLQMFQLPLVQLSRTRWLRGRKTLGNLIFWLGIFTGPSLLCSLYLIL